MKIEIFKGNWGIDDVNLNKNKIFVYGDNDIRIGKGGQAIIRDLPNTFGIRTKKSPSKKETAYYTDDEIDINKKNILEDIITLKYKALQGNIIVFSDGGYGTGLALLKDKAPKTFEYLCFLLREHFGFDNIKGVKWKKIPGYDDITSGIYIDFDNNESIIKPINNSFFNPNYLKQKLYNNYDLIKSGNKIAFTSNIFYKNGDILIFKFKGKEYLVCRVIESYDTLFLNDDKWHLFEGYDINFDISGSKVQSKYQTHFQFISTLNSEGIMVYDKDIFGGLDKKPIDIIKKEETKVMDEPLFPLKEKRMAKKEENEMSDDFKTLIESIEKINNKMDIILSEIKKPKFRLFKKKELNELLEERGIIGKISKIDGLTSTDNYEVDCEDVIYFLKFKKGFFYNKIDVIIKKDKK